MVPNPLPIAYDVYAFINVDNCERPLMALILIGNMISDICIKFNGYLHVFLVHVAPSVVSSIRSRAAGLQLIEI